MNTASPNEVLDKYNQGGSSPQASSTHSSPKVNLRVKKFHQIQGQYSPGRILAITIGGIVLAEVIAMVFVYHVRDWSYDLQVLLDAAIMTAIIFPLLYFLSFRPLLQHIQQRYRSESILQARLRLIQFANTHTLEELLQFALDEIETLTGSTISFFDFIEADQKTIRLQAWSTRTLQEMCKAEGKDSHYDVDQAGVWADAIRLRQPVIHNDLASLPHCKGMPDGHAPVSREIVIPVLRDNKVKAIVGTGNKPDDFTLSDVELVSTFADFAWDIIEHKLAEDAIHQSEEKFRTFVDWTYDWEKLLDPQGNILYTSPSCERITGYRADEFIADPDLLIHIVHPNDRRIYQEHQQVIHEETVGPSRIEYRLIDRDGNEHWIEHVCQPVFGTDGHYLGRRVSNRDITQRKRAEEKIIEQNQKELILTKTIQSIQSDIARDLHDTLGQNISFLRMNLEHLSEATPSDPNFIKTQIQRMTRTANESYDLIRTMLFILHSGNSTDPFSLFTHYVEQVAERSSIKIDITSQGYPKQLSPHQIRQLFYIFREALSNIEKHASADRVAVEFTYDEHALSLVISDNGRGFDLNAVESPDHYGLKFMRERAELMKASFSAQSAPGQGTTIKVVLPYENEVFVQSQ